MMDVWSEQMKKYKLSVSKVKLFGECPSCFWLQENKDIKRPSGPMSSLPLGMDRCLKNFFDKHREQNSIPSLLDQIRLFDNKEKISIWRNYRKGLVYQDIEGSSLRGAIDDIGIDPEGRIFPIDFKTKGNPPTEQTIKYYQLQMDFYSFLLRFSGYETINQGYLLFYSPLEVTDGQNVKFQCDLVKIETNPGSAYDLFLEAIKTLHGERPEVRCDFCRDKGDSYG